MNGIAIILYNRIYSGTDQFNKPLYEEIPETVENVLVAPSSDQEVLDALNLYGRKAIYTLAIPKGDQHEWEDRTVEFFGHKWKTIGIPQEGIENLIPLKWNKKVRVERYGEDDQSRA